jgi:hypothetical protein
MIRQNSAEYGSITRAEEKLVAAEEAKKNEIKDASTDQKATASFPYNIEQDDSMFSSKYTKLQDRKHNSETLVADKGFFVKGNEYLDEYVAATAADLPEDDMNE